jgi:hypothetical protein
MDKVRKPSNSMRIYHTQFKQTLLHVFIANNIQVFTPTFILSTLQWMLWGVKKG